MKSIFLKLLLLLVAIQNSFGQYIKFADTGGFIVSKGAMISSVSTAGGGVVLVGVAKPKYPESVAVFTNVTFSETSYISTMNIHTPELIMSFSDSSWLMRDAAMLVDSEIGYEMYRNVNLLGGYTDEELRDSVYENYPTDVYYIVEMSESLVDTRSGQTLLYADLILSSRASTDYYSFDRDASDIYVYTRNMLIDSYQDFLISYYNSVGIETDSSFYESPPRNYTYHDEFTDYLFSYNKVDRKLVIEGVPSYAFLDAIGLDSEGNELYEVNPFFTSFYVENFFLIKNLNDIVFTNAEHFSQAAAFFRYLKGEYPQLWSRTIAHYENTRKRRGDTPRFIAINPLIQNDKDNYE